MRKLIFTFGLISISFFCFSQRVGININSNDALLTLTGIEDTIFRIKDYQNKNLMYMTYNRRFTMGQKSLNSLLSLSNDFNPEQLFIRSQDFGVTEMQFISSQAIDKRWDVTSFSFPNLQSASYLNIIHNEAPYGLYFSGDRKLSLGSVTSTGTLNIGGNLRWSKALMPDGQAGLPGQILKYTYANTPPIWVNPTNHEYQALKSIEINNTQFIHGGLPSMTLFNLPLTVEDTCYINFSIGSVVQGDDCLLCGKARGFIEVTFEPTVIPPAPYDKSEHFQQFYFEVDKGKIQSVNGTSHFLINPAIHAIGNYILSARMIIYDGGFYTGTGHITSSSPEDYYFNYKYGKI
jgi:hypothetical protein